MEEQSDSTVIKNMSIVLAILITFTISIFFIAKDVSFNGDQEENPARAQLAAKRIMPVATAYPAENGPVTVAETAAPAAAPAAPAAAFDGSLDAEMIFTTVCAACHATGVAGAPQPGTPAMAERAAKGIDALMQSALNGLNAMPARGGRADLSDEQVRAVVEFMTQ